MNFVELNLHPILVTALVTIGIYIVIIAFTRITGLGSFSKRSPFDFATTVAVGSIFGAVATRGADFLTGIVALGLIFGGQVTIAYLRKRHGFEHVVENGPLLLMNGDEILHGNLVKARVTEKDIAAKLREANVLRLSEVKAVVFETTGDITVLHGNGEVDPFIMTNVYRS